jgi:hypothetical protein
LGWMSNLTGQVKKDGRLVVPVETAGASLFLEVIDMWSRTKVYEGYTGAVSGVWQAEGTAFQISMAK